MPVYTTPDEGLRMYKADGTFVLYGDLHRILADSGRSDCACWTCDDLPGECPDHINAALAGFIGPITDGTYDLEWNFTWGGIGGPISFPNKWAYFWQDGSGAYIQIEAYCSGGSYLVRVQSSDTSANYTDATFAETIDDLCVDHCPYEMEYTESGDTYGNAGTVELSFP